MSKLTVDTFLILISSVFKQYKLRHNHQTINYMIFLLLFGNWFNMSLYCLYILHEELPDQTMLDGGCQDTIGTAWIFL